LLDGFLFFSPGMSEKCSVLFFILKMKLFPQERKKKRFLFKQNSQELNKNTSSELSQGVWDP
jgi:hypothetical protein